MRQAVNRIVAAVVFVCILLVLMIETGFFARPIDKDADNMSYLYKEDKNSVNVVCMGSSAMYRFWIPQQAYEEQQFTSSLVSTASQSIKAVPYLMDEVKKTQDVDLFVVEIRSPLSDEAREIRGMTEKKDILMSRLSSIAMGMKPSVNRLNMINKLLVEDEKNKKLEWMVPILKYHDNIHKFTSDEMVERLNGIDQKDVYTRQTYMVEKQKKITFENNPEIILSEESKMAIDCVVEKADELGTKVLLISTPYIPTKTRGALQLQMAEYIRQQGYDYLDMSDQYKEIGLDLNVDFYDKNHTNIVGAKKVTTYLDLYIAENYDLRNCLDDAQKIRWKEICETWNEEENKLIELWKQEVEKGTSDEKE